MKFPIVKISEEDHNRLRNGTVPVSLSMPGCHADDRSAIVQSSLGSSYVGLSPDHEGKPGIFWLMPYTPPLCWPIVKDAELVRQFHFGVGIMVPHVEVPVFPGSVIVALIDDTRETALVVDVTETSMFIIRPFKGKESMP